MKSSGGKEGVEPTREIDIDPAIAKRDNAAIAVRAWEQRLGRVQRAREAYLTDGRQTLKNRYELELDAERAARNWAIGLLTHVGKRLTIGEMHYKAVPSRMEIRRTRAKRGDE